MKKRIFILILAILVLVSLTACFKNSPAIAPTEDTTPTTEDASLQNERKSILIVGNSHSVDAFWLLYRAWKDQYPDENLCIGILHYGGASISEHVDFANSQQSVIRYYKNDTGKWKVTYDVTTQSVLTDEAWDIILMQPAKEDLADPTLNAEGRHALAEIIDRYVTTPHEYMWHISWPSPNDETFFSPEYVRQPPEGYKEKLTRLYGFNPVTQYSLMLDQTKKNILDDPLYTKAVCSGAAVMHALLVQEMPQLDLWRDYTHLSDYARLMVGYALVAQLNNTPIESVGIDVITVGWRHKQNKGFGPLELTAELKQGIIDGANYALRSPWVLPEKAK